MTDLQLIEQALDGNDHAFEQIVRKYENRVAATVIGMLGKCDAADDVGQEVFIRFYKVMHKFRGSANLGTYLTRIAINLSINELKRRKRRLMFFSKPDDRPFPEPAGEPDDSAVNSEEKELVQKAIQKLDTKFRSVVVLRLMEGYSTEETAKILSIPIGTVLSRLARAQKKLKVLLAPIILEEV